MDNIFRIFILSAIWSIFFIKNFARYLNIRHIKETLPTEYQDIYDQESYSKSQKYLRETTIFSMATSLLSSIILTICMLSGFFNYIDLIARSYELSMSLTGIIFFGILFILNDLVSIPFAIYNIFYLEEKFGFNKTTLNTFILDKLKSYFLIILIGAPVIFGILIFFEKYSLGWLYAWIALSIFSLALQPIFTTFIAPMFNKFTPLEEGTLKEMIVAFADSVNFPIKNIDVIDGSKRSSKSNAYFSGIGKRKRIALYDTLIKNQNNHEILSIIAHEVGHYKKHHIWLNIFFSVIISGFNLYLLSLFINNTALFVAFNMQPANLSIYASLLFFSILFTPLDFILSIFLNILSRKHEYEADAFAAEHTENPELLISALKKLTSDNMGNLFPHPVYVFLNYSHPSVLSRINRLKST